MTELLRISSLTKTFPPEQTVLKDLNLDLPSGMMIGIVGPDGAGKTTLMRLIAALLTPTSGRIEVLGLDTVKDAERLHAFTGYMPQRFGLYEDLTVRQNLDLYASLRGLSAKREETFEELLRFTGLKPFQKRRVGALSGGMKQKLGLACTLIAKPKVLILDEPSVGVDPISRRELWEMVQTLIQEGVSVLWSTAYLNEAEKCKKIVLLNEGKILFVGEPSELTRKVEGRVFLIEDTSTEKRQHLARLENEEAVVDALIQGKDLRIVTKATGIENGVPTSARLEDAFVDLLGGNRKGESKLSKAAPVSPIRSSEQKQAVIATNLVKRFGSFTAVDHISFSIQRGEIFALLGPNGSGKSTTFKMLTGLLKPTEGQAIVGGYDLQVAPGLARSKIGYMAQKFSLYGNLTVRQNLEFFSGIYSCSGSVDEKLELSDLESFQNISAELLPAGIKQRLALAVALIHWPEILFLDEPTSGMDPVSRRTFWSEMNGLARIGKTILVSTHFMDEAENCDRIALIYKGKIIELGTPDKLKELTKDGNQNPTLEDAFVKLIQEYDASQL